MLYLSGKQVKGHPFLQAPHSGHSLDGIPVWAVDNGCFTGKYPGDEKFLKWLDNYLDRQDDCLWVACPDVLTDAEATLQRWKEMSPRIRERGWRAALVLQDGMTVQDVQEAAPDAVFIGGSTEYKMGETVREIVAAMKEMGVPAHMGRVNSLKRMRYASLIGCVSVDGTVLAFDQTRPVFHWADAISSQETLF